MPPHSSTGGASGSRPWIWSQTSDPTMPTLGTAVDENLGRAVDAGAAGQLTRNDAADTDRRFEGSSGNLPPQRNEQVVSGERHPSTDNHHFGIEDVQQVGDSGAQELGRVVHHFKGEIITVVRSLVHR